MEETRRVCSCLKKSEKVSKNFNVRNLQFDRFNVLVKTLDGGLEDGADVSSTDRRDLVESLDATLGKLSNSNGSADSSSSGSEDHFAEALLLYSIVEP